MWNSYTDYGRRHARGPEAVLTLTNIGIAFSIAASNLNLIATLNGVDQTFIVQKLILASAILVI